MIDPSSESLWSFAVRVYACEGVAEQCLHLQDEYGLDVDVLLAALWLAARGGAWDEDLLTRMLKAAAPARARVQESRKLRRAVGREREQGPAWQAAYERLKEAELDAERMELECIEVVLRDAPPSTEPASPTTLAYASMQRYAARVSAEEAEPSLRRLIATALPSEP